MQAYAATAFFGLGAGLWARGMRRAAQQAIILHTMTLERCCKSLHSIPVVGKRV